MDSPEDELSTFRVPRHRSLPGRAEGREPAGPGHPPELAATVPAPAEIDLQALARKVHDLLRQEVRLERERRGWNRPL